MGFQRTGLGLFASTLLFPFLASATVTLHSYSQYIPSAKLTADSEEITLYAGRTNRACTSANPSFTNTSGTCDSCAKDSTNPIALNPCNSREIYPELPFSITISSDQADDYPSCSRLVIGRVVGSDTYFAADSVSTYQTGAAGQSVTANFNWGTLCQAAGGENSCSKSFNSRFEFGFDADCSMNSVSAAPQFNILFRYVSGSPAMNLGCASPGVYEGLCSYSIFPGDEKVFVKDPQGVTANEFYVPDLTLGTTGTSKDPSGMKYSHFRVYYKAGTIAGGTANSMTTADSFKDLGISGTKLSEERVTGLTNGTPYVFLGAMVDQAGNVTHFAQPGALQAIHEGTPEEVYGLLDNKGCFVATAAYGTPQANEIQVLRDFRDVSLAHSEWGRAFIRFYYKHSPEWAAVIRENETLRTAVRIGLTPVIWTTEKILNWYYGIYSHKAPESEAAKGNP